MSNKFTGIKSNDVKEIHRYTNAKKITFQVRGLKFYNLNSV